MENGYLICSYCGRPCPKGAIVSVNENAGPDEPAAYIMCANCFQMTKSCTFCLEAYACPFETSDNPLPKQVQQTIRQGNAVIQTIVKNPERIRETCQKGCKCWSEEFGCLKENGICGNYKEVLPNVKM